MISAYDLFMGMILGVAFIGVLLVILAPLVMLGIKYVDWLIRKINP